MREKGVHEDGSLGRSTGRMVYTREYRSKGGRDYGRGRVQEGVQEGRREYTRELQGGVGAHRTSTRGKPAFFLPRGTALLVTT